MPSPKVTRRMIEANVIKAKTADYTVTKADIWSPITFTTRGAAGSVTFTLPAASGNSGAVVEFINLAGQDMVIAAQDEELVAQNDLTADSATFDGVSEQIGAACRCICDGSSWIFLPVTTFDGVNTTQVTITSA